MTVVESDFKLCTIKYVWFSQLRDLKKNLSITTTTGYPIKSFYKNMIRFLIPVWILRISNDDSLKLLSLKNSLEVSLYTPLKKTTQPYNTEKNCDILVASSDIFLQGSLQMPQLFQGITLINLFERSIICHGSKCSVLNISEEMLRYFKKNLEKLLICNQNVYIL